MTELFVGISIAAVLGIFAGWLLWGRRTASVAALERDLAGQSGRIDILSSERDRISQEKSSLDNKVVELSKLLSSFETEKNILEKRISERERDLRDMQEKISDQFKNLANSIFEAHTDKFKIESAEKLDGILSPVREKIEDFRKKVEEVYSNESKERFHLKEMVKDLVAANAKISEEAKNLAIALKGDVKAQGNWGEVVLERILEASGLREGEEYIVQGTDLNLSNEDGRVQRPDVIVNLPDNKHLIIDSKVSLVHYTRYVAEQNDELKETHLNEMIGSIYSHIDGLHKKKYEYLSGLISPECVLMFMPLEGAFSLAFQRDNELLNYTLGKRVVIVSPSTLMVVLMAIASVWKQERQTKNANEIARQAGGLYDKFVGLMGDLNKIEEQLKGTLETFDKAKNKLQYGKGNLVSRVENLRKLGAKTSNLLSEAEIVEQNLDEVPQQTQ